MTGSPEPCSTYRIRTPFESKYWSGANNTAGVKTRNRRNRFILSKLPRLFIKRPPRGGLRECLFDLTECHTRLNHEYRFIHFRDVPFIFLHVVFREGAQLFLVLHNLDASFHDERFSRIAWTK